MTLKLSILSALIATTIATCIDPIYPEEQFLQHLGTALIMSILVVDLFRQKLPLTAYIGVSLFILIHIIGARYIYSAVPYEDWFERLFGLDLNSERNHYDRFVHLSFGFLFFPYVLYLTHKWLPVSKSKVIIVAWLFIQGLSLFYELFEWFLTIIISGEAAENYNGQQGDMWDAHKDMALAMLSSGLAAIYYLIAKKDRLFLRRNS